MKKYCLAIALVALLALVGCAEHEHSWDSGVVTKPATCTEKGEMTYTCLVCEATRTEKIDAIGHKWDDGAVTTNPSCTDAGVKTFTCTVCNETKTEEILAIGHNPGEDYKCSDCGQYFYPSLEEFNSKVTLENSKGVVVTVKLGDETFGDIAYSDNNSGYTGKGLGIGRDPNEAEVLNKHSATPAKVGEYKYVLKGGTITSTAKGYSSIDGLNGTSVYMLVPGNADVVFDGVTFDGVFSFDVQMFTSPWSYLNSITFRNCTFNGLIVGYCPANIAVFEDCTFNSDHTNTVDANNSNPIWWRASTGYWGAGADESIHSLQKFVFEGNIVTGTRPVKIERMSWNCHAVITIKNNKFDISKQEGDTETKNMAINIGQKDSGSSFTLIDEGNEISENTASLYTAALTSGTNQYIAVSGNRILDGNGNPKKITALVWKSATKTFVMESID